MLPHQTQDSFQHDAGDETTVIYSEVKITPEVKEEVATQVDEKVKEEVATQGDEKVKEEVATQVDEKVKEEVATQGGEKGKEMQRGEGEQSDKNPPPLIGSHFLPFQHLCIMFLHVVFLILYR